MLKTILAEAEKEFFEEIAYHENAHYIWSFISKLVKKAYEAGREEGLAQGLRLKVVHKFVKKQNKLLTNQTNRG